MDKAPSPPNITTAAFWKSEFVTTLLPHVKQTFFRSQNLFGEAVVQSNVMSKSKLDMKPTAAFHNDSGDYFLD